MKPVRTLLATSLLAVTAACGGGDGRTVVTDPDAGDAPDAGGQQAACQAQASYGTVTAVPEATFAYWTGGTVATPDFAVLGTALNADAAPDGAQVELYKGFGAFTGEIVPGSYTLSGDELQYSSCGVCVTIQADVTEANGASSVYLATGGTVVVNSVSPDLSVTLTNVTFEHVTISETNPFPSTPVGDGCNSGVTAATIAGPSQPLPM